MDKTTEILKFKSTDGIDIIFPVATVTGELPGPHFVITAGIHGCEYPAIVAAIQLFKELDPKNVSGKITIVTISNLKSFEERCMFVCPVDKKNPNRFFPGNITGTYTDNLTYYLLNKIICKGDYHIDLHGGDMVEALDPFSIYHIGVNTKIDSLSKEIAQYYSLHNIVATKTDGEWPDNGTTYANASKINVPSAIVEVGGIGQLTQDDVDIHLFGLKNVLRHFGCLNGEAIEPTNLQYYEKFIWIYCKHKGIFYKNVNIGDNIKPNQLLGTLEDYFGNKLEDIISEVSGKVLFLTTSPSISENGLLMGIGII